MGILVLGDNVANLLFGGIGADTLVGFGGDDTLVGGQGGDILDGGIGRDTASYFNSAAAVQVNLAGVNTGGAAQGDILVSIENLTGSIFGDRIKGNGGGNILTGLGGNDTIEGGGGDDTLLGGNGNDRLDGGAGADSMNGGTGNDTYVVDQAGDRVNETGGTGIDIVLASRSVDLTSAQFSGAVENVTLTGTADLDATGNGGDNIIRGNSGDNGINGGIGLDTMIGGAGNDIYVVTSGGDVVDEGAPGSGGTDLVISTVTFNLRGAQVAGTQNAVENLILSGNTAINGFGNDGNNRIIGNAADNVLIGFAGNDVLSGGGGIDTFVFRSPLNPSTNVDTVTDFDIAQDRIQLENLFMQSLGSGPLDPDAFHIGAAAADAEDRIIYNALTGNLSYDADGTGGAAATRFAILDPGLALSGADFTVI